MSILVGALLFLPVLDDPAEQREEALKVFVADGVIGEVMYPSVNMAAFAYPERDVVHAVFRRHNDWMREYCSALRWTMTLGARKNILDTDTPMR